MTVRIEDATKFHVEELLVQPLRPQDAIEWESGLGKPAKWAVRDAAYGKDTKLVRAIVVDGRTVALFGVTLSHIDGKDVGCVWLCASNYPYNAIAMAQHFHCNWREEVVRLHQAGGEKLIAVADERNTPHHAWLKTMGFEVLEEGNKAISADGSPFTIYGRKQPCAAP